MQSSVSGTPCGPNAGPGSSAASIRSVIAWSTSRARRGKLAIEIDGGQHAANHVADVARTAELAGHGYRVIRFWNNEVMGNIDGVLLVVLGALEEAPTSP